MKVFAGIAQVATDFEPSVGVEILYSYSDERSVGLDPINKGVAGYDEVEEAVSRDLTSFAYPFRCGLSAC